MVADVIEECVWGRGKRDRRFTGFVVEALGSLDFQRCVSIGVLIDGYDLNPLFLVGTPHDIIEYTPAFKRDPMDLFNISVGNDRRNASEGVRGFEDSVLGLSEGSVWEAVDCFHCPAGQVVVIGVIVRHVSGSPFAVSV
jgi:hypothetical protein